MPIANVKMAKRPHGGSLHDLPKVFAAIFASKTFARILIQLVSPEVASPSDNIDAVFLEHRDFVYQI